jgi:hypothetical protein
MRDFIDVRGSSGAAYRFRLWAEGSAYSPAGGNYVFVRAEPTGFAVTLVARTNDLSKAITEWPAAQQRGATHLFTRLNVSRTIREAEHQDLADRYVDAGAPEGTN